MARWAYTRQFISSLGSASPRLSAARTRSTSARACLDRVRRGVERSPDIAQPAPPAHLIGHASRAVGRAVIEHGWLIVLVLLVAFGDPLGGWSERIIAAKPSHDAQARGSQIRMPASESTGEMILPLTAVGAGRRSVAQPLPVAPIAPAQSIPLEISDAFREVHLLEGGETLGDLARRYGVSLPSIIWSNGLDRGDALLLGQPLRIPRISGVPYVVTDGEAVGDIAARFGVVPDAISAFGPNHLQDGRDLAVGEEIFIPGGDPPLPDLLLAQGGLDALAARGAEPTGIVLEDETNLREGPGTDYHRQIQLDHGRQVALRARHAGWLKVEIAGVAGWIRVDMLQIASGLVDGLPETDDFPPPPPRWVWPTWGTLTSPFGARWGAFHNGIDIANRAWTPIVAARAGRVREAGWCSGYGYCVKISHGGGVETIYGHLVTKPSVAAGDEVAAGQRIGSMGSTYDRVGGGYSTGVHLHFTVLVNGRAVNPLTVLP
ncbi:peptidoglycan DD-metalloendopeptidase family protein [Chloroflexales bacterium ZM16-3]|nr:peptidoglycan DD-metalloendopeptidase family protein [Chloroflexales bacterium ZM16-3]